MAQRVVMSILRLTAWETGSDVMDRLAARKAGRWVIILLNACRHFTNVHTYS